MNEYPNPSNKQTSRDLAIMIAIMAVLLAIFCIGLFKYDRSHNTSVQAYVTLKKQLNTIQIKQTALDGQYSVLGARNTELTNEKIQFCADLAKAKVVEPLCAK